MPYLAINNYLTTYHNFLIYNEGISASQGGDEIDGVFRCIADENRFTFSAIDTYNIHGGHKLNLGDGGMVNNVMCDVHESRVNKNILNGIYDT